MLLEFFNELKRIVLEENSYLRENTEIDSVYLDKLVMKKKILQDKIEKEQKKINISFENEEIQDKNIIKKIIEDILKIEDENKELYKLKMNNVRKNLGYLYKERQVKTSYIKSGLNMSKFDKKK